MTSVRNPKVSFARYPGIATFTCCLYLNCTNQVTFSLAVRSTKTVIAVTTKSIFVLESVLALFKVIKLITPLYASDF